MRLSYAIFALAVFTGTAQAQDLVYEPVNPSFGGSSFNSAHLLALANAQNDYERPVDEDDELTDLDRFISSLESRLLSSLSTQVANAIFGEDAQDSGTIRFGDQTISFENTFDGIQLTITDADGTVTVITIPSLQTSGDGDETDEEDEDDADTKSSFTNNRMASVQSEEALNVVGGLPYQSLRPSNDLLQPIQQPIQ